MNAKGRLIIQDEDISVYDKEFLDHVPSGMRVGGHITVVNNLSGERRWKEWKWYQRDDGTMFNDKKYVIDMLSRYVRTLDERVTL